MNSPYREHIRHHIRTAVHEARYAPILGTFANIKKAVMAHGNGYFSEPLVEVLIREELQSALKSSGWCIYYG